MTEKRLHQARHQPDSYIEMYVDYGGIFLLSCPVRLIQCSERNLRDLGKEIARKICNPTLSQGLEIVYHTVTNDRTYAHMRKMMRETGWRGDKGLYLTPEVKAIPGIEQVIQNVLREK